jgi:hypothetical protein
MTRTTGRAFYFIFNTSLCACFSSSLSHSLPIIPLLPVGTLVGSRLGYSDVAASFGTNFLGIGHGGFFLRGTGHARFFFSRVLPRVPIGYRNRLSFTQRGLFNI